MRIYSESGVSSQREARFDVHAYRIPEVDLVGYIVTYELISGNNNLVLRCTETMPAHSSEYEVIRAAVDVADIMRRLNGDAPKTLWVVIAELAERQARVALDQFYGPDVRPLAAEAIAASMKEVESWSGKND